MRPVEWSFKPTFFANSGAQSDLFCSGDLAQGSGVQEDVLADSVRSFKEREARNSKKSSALCLVAEAKAFIRTLTISSWVGAPRRKSRRL